MARMIPADPPFWGPGTTAERAIFEGLRAALPDEVVVAYGLRLVDGRAGAEGEADFVIAWPGRGLLLVECKGQGVRMDKARGWVRVDERGREPLRESPFEQAERTLRGLVDALGERLPRVLPDLEGCFPLPYGYAVAFPLARWRDGELPLDAPREILWDSGDVADLRARVEGAIDLWSRRGQRQALALDKRQWKRFVDNALLPRLNIVACLGARLDAERQAFVRLTPEQQRLIRGLLDNRRILVRGRAGSGKTVCALEAARQHAAEGRRVLLACFTTWLEDELRARVAEADMGPGPVRVARFHALCEQAFGQMGLPWRPPDPDVDSRGAAEFWNTDAPLQLYEAITKGKMPAWDAIVVDEGQDFAADWWGVLTGLFPDDAKGHLVVFADPRQDLFGRGALPPDEGLVRYTLPYVLRNTKEIARFVAALEGSEVEPHPDCPVGEPVRVVPQKPGDLARGQIANVVRDLLGKGEVPVEALTLLTPHSRRRSFLAGQTHLAGVPLADDPADRAGRLLHASIGKFKGLESPVLILADVDRDDARSDGRAVYVAASRAQQRLIVFEKSPWLAEVAASLP